MNADHKAALLRAQSTRPLSMIIFEDSEDTRLDLNLAAAYLELHSTLEVANAAHRGAEAEVTKWKRIYENTIVKDEGMLLYDEIKRLNERAKHLEDVILKGVWPK